ncbi:hypothetical protein [Streptomyces sp. NPDC050388]|uniref:hypothetical protein n=1 Tax=Streptomyces sp. NPDC050388 TaxID=3155781 RepID=UPI00343AF10C
MPTGASRIVARAIAGRRRPASGQQPAAPAHDGVAALRQSGDEVVRVRGAGRREDLPLTGDLRRHVVSDEREPGLIRVFMSLDLGTRRRARTTASER